MKTPEGIVKAAVVSYLKMRGWFVMINVQQGFGNVRGRPDLEAIKNGITIFVECKAGKGRLSEHQKTYIRLLQAHGAIVLVISSGDECVRDIDALEERLWPEQASKRLC